VNTRPGSIRSLVAVGITATLALAACGGDDDTSDDTTATTATTAAPAEDSAESSDEPSGDVAMQPASISFDAQESDGTMVVVAAVELPADGFIAVHGDGGGSPGPVVGHSELLPAGASTDVMVMLDTPLDADTTLYPMAHIDTDGNGAYEFGSVEGVDGPALTTDGEVAVVGADVTVTAGGEADDADDAATGETITIAGFAFTGATEVAVGTTVTVVNEDGSDHTWTADDGTFSSGNLAPGDSFEFTFDEPGTYTYACRIHPTMTGTITVTG
jgi:plastocyanin